MDYLRKLEKVIAKWNEDPIKDEWVFQKFREDVVGEMTPEKAFMSIGDTILVMIKQSDESTSVEILETILSLARQSNTTEVPKELSKNKEIIVGQFQKYGEYANRKLTELNQYYRLQ